MCVFRQRAAGWALLLAAAGLFGYFTLSYPARSPELLAQAKGDPKGAPAGDDAAVRKAGAAYLAAMEKGDVDAVLAFWTADADYIDEAGTTTRGKERIAERFRKTLPELKGSKLALKVNSLKFLRPDVCLEDGTVDVTTPSGVKESGRYAVIWTRAGDQWLIASVRDLPTESTDLPSLAAARLRDLGWLVGEWVDEGAKASVSLTVRWAPNKAFLLMDYTVTRDGAEPMAVSVRVGWDGANGRIRSWTFDSNGGFGEGLWQKDGKRWLVGTSGVLPDGGTGGSTNVYEFVDENAFVWRSTEREVDGQPLADVEVKFVRKPASK